MVESRTVSIDFAARKLGIGRTMAFQLASRGEFPCRVLRIGRLYKVPVAELERLLGEREPVAVGAERAS
jgi:hypothetical protein